MSAYVVYDVATGRPTRSFGKLPNDEVLALVIASCGKESTLAIEMIASQGMSVGAEVFETCVWVGRFMQTFGASRTVRVYRNQVKLHLCGQVRAKDGNVRQALIDRYGGPTAVGTKKAPGILYGISNDVWQALACAVTFVDTL